MIRRKTASTYIFLRVFDSLLKLRRQGLQNPQLISFRRQIKILIRVKEIVVDPGLDIWVAEELFRWPGEEVGLEKLEILPSE